MAKILMTMPPLAGHINPALAVAAQLQARGHDVAWALHGEMAADRLPVDAKILSLPIENLNLVESPRDVRGLESVRFFYEDFCLPLARGSLFPLEKIVRDYAPDFIYCDQQMVAGAFVARKLNIPWLTSVTTTAPILKMSPQHDAWVAQKFRELEEVYPLPETMDRPDFSPHAVVVFSSRQLIGDNVECFDAPYHFVGPAYGARATQDDFPWEKLENGKRKILISLGTVSRDRSARFYEVMMTALGDMDIQVVMVASEDFTKRAPANFIVRPRVPQLQLLPHMDAVICHAGHNTVCESLAQGLPLIVAPIRDDQSVIARQVIDCGAGLFMRFGKVTPATARATVEQLLGDSELKRNALRLAESFAGLGGAECAANIVEQLLLDKQTQQQNSQKQQGSEQLETKNESGEGGENNDNSNVATTDRGIQHVLC